DEAVMAAADDHRIPGFGHPARPPPCSLAEMIGEIPARDSGDIGRRALWPRNAGAKMNHQAPRRQEEDDGSLARSAGYPWCLGALVVEAAPAALAARKRRSV